MTAQGRHQVSATAAALAAAGAVTLWAGLKGVSIASGFRSLLGGHAPPVPDETYLSVAEGLQSTADAGHAAAAALGASTSGSRVASTAAEFVGKSSKYRWGGATDDGGWDCSGFCNFIIGYLLELPIPGHGNGFNPRSGGHGPVTAQWAIWSGATNIDRGSVSAGDLVVWPAVHMAIAANNSQMITCPGPNGTPAPVIQTIDRAHLGPLVCRRLIKAG